MQIFVQRMFCVFSLLLAITPTGTAFGYTSIISFGDSLSDNGNVNRFTDGTLWIEHLAEHYSIPLIDLAFGGATTDIDNPAAAKYNASLHHTGLKSQVNSMVTSEMLTTGNNLISLWAGANDFLQGRDYSNAASNIHLALNELYDKGGKNFLVPNLPDIGSTPMMQSAPTQPDTALLATYWTNCFNSLLLKELQDFVDNHNDVILYYVDVFTIFENYQIGSTDWHNLFWYDGFHPSSMGHTVIFNSALTSLSTVPEPPSIFLITLGLAGIAIRRKRFCLERQNHT